jgi:hypothetical protein
MNTMGGEIDSEALEEILDMLDNAPVPELELDFNTDESDGEGHIYESIEDEVGEAADAAAIEYLLADDDDEWPLDHEGLPTDFEDVLPESFYEGLTGG